LPLYNFKGADLADFKVGNFAGMGLETRVNTCDVYGLEMTPDLPLCHKGPSIRMSHTLTSCGDGYLLVGGRTSPDQALADCWLYHNNVWERVDDLPLPRYRHQAVDLGYGRVLVSPGKTNSRAIDGTFYIFNREMGWRKCIQGPGENPCATFGASCFTLASEPDIDQPVVGILAGGISEGSIFQQDVWKWELRYFPTKVSDLQAFPNVSHIWRLPLIFETGASHCIQSF
jgi:tRNA wybutosine-synthesizing protein 4